MLSSGSGNQLCSPPAVLLWNWGFAVLFNWGLLSLLCSFLWGKVSNLSAGPLLLACCDSLLFVFQLCKAVLLWMLLSDSGDEFFGPLPDLFQAVAYYLPAVSPSAFPAFVY
jgi:hypothetical protein